MVTPTQALAWKIEQKDGVTHVALSGEVTEDTHFHPLVQSLRGPVVMDLSGVRRFNSFGVREWLGFMRALADPPRSVVFERCSLSVAAQLNMIANFAGPAQVKSVQAPYFCRPCTQEHLRLLETGPLAVKRLGEPFPCPVCQAPMEFDDLPEEFLSFQDPSPPRERA